MRKREGGFIALTSVLIIGAIVLILGVSLFHSALTDYSISTAFESGQQAAFLADFCLKEGVLKLQEDINYIGGEEINVSNATCTINFVKQIDENTKEISSLGRASDQPHFSRASREIRYIIESSADDWEHPEAELENLKIVGDSLILESAEAEEINRLTDTSDEWRNNYFYLAENIEITEGGSLVLAAIEPEPPPKKGNGELCSDGSECQSGYCQNNICCTTGTCCSSDSQCPDSCQDNCTKIDRYCDTATDHNCKSTTVSCNCTGSCKCDGGVCTGPWDWGTTMINGSWDRNCNGTVEKEYTRYTNSSCATVCDCGQTCSYTLSKSGCTSGTAVTIRCR